MVLRLHFTRCVPAFALHTSCSLECNQSLLRCDSSIELKLQTWTRKSLVPSILYFSYRFCMVTCAHVHRDSPNKYQSGCVNHELSWNGFYHLRNSFFFIHPSSSACSAVLHLSRSKCHEARGGKHRRQDNQPFTLTFIPNLVTNKPNVHVSGVWKDISVQTRPVRWWC